MNPRLIRLLFAGILACSLATVPSWRRATVMGMVKAKAMTSRSETTTATVAPNMNFARRIA